MDMPENEITAIIGPSGAGKSTLLRCINRLNDLIEIFRMEGEMWFGDFNLYAPESDPTQIQIPHRDGVPAAEPVPEVDLRQHRIWPADQRVQGEAWTT